MRFSLFIFAIAVFASCTSEAYETGDSRYSYLRTDFVLAQTNSKAQIVSAVTDDGVSLALSSPTSVSWAAKGDTTYRALFYYLSENSSTASTVEPVKATRVYVLRPDTSAQASTAADPVHLQSAWQSANGSYANLTLALMTGVADSVDAKQTIGLRCDSIVDETDGNHTYYYMLTHSQGSVPQYYKSTIYVSIPTKDMTLGDQVKVTLNTYNGTVTKTFSPSH